VANINVSWLVSTLAVFLSKSLLVSVTDKKGLSQPACAEVWKKYEERDE
jgi:hypothetical protein